LILDPYKRYDRRNSILYEDGIPFIKLKQIFPDREDLQDGFRDYMNSHFINYPNSHEIIMYKPIVKIFYDLETTGVDFMKNGIHHISGLIEIDDEIRDEFDFRVKPHPKSVIEDKALEVSNTTREDLEGFAGMEVTYRKLLEILGKHCDRFDRKDKIWLIGFNNRKFDDLFLRKWFELNKDAFFGSWFWSDTLDVMVLTSQYLIERRRSMKNFKLQTVAHELGIVVDESRLHDAKYDLELTRDIYRIVTGLEIEL